jgi:hypothetical protein
MLVGGVLCTLSALAMNLTLSMVEVRAGGRVTASLRLACVVVPKHDEVKNGTTKTE